MSRLLGPFHKSADGITYFLLAVTALAMLLVLVQPPPAISPDAPRPMLWAE